MGMVRVGTLMAGGSFLGGGGTSSSLAALLAAGEANALALDFTDLSAVVRDTGTPANNFSGSPATLLTYTSPSAKYILNSSGLLESASTIRTEYDVNGNPLGVRVEEQRTNLATKSEDIVNWHAGGGAATAASTTVPTGATATALFTVTSASYTQYSSSTAASAVPYTASMYAKAGTVTSFKMGPSTDYTGSTFNLSNGTVSANDSGCVGSIEDAGNGWYRCICTRTLTATTYYCTIYVQSTGTISLWGGQLEVGAFATSYIATTTATVTRAADDISLVTSAFPYSSTVALLYAKYLRSVKTTGVQTAVSITSAVASTDTIGLYHAPGSSLGGVAWIASERTQLFSSHPAIGAVTKIAVCANTAGTLAAVSTNGQAAATSSSSDWDGGSTKLILGSIDGVTFPLNSHIQQVLYLPQYDTAKIAVLSA